MLFVARNGICLQANARPARPIPATSAARHYDLAVFLLNCDCQGKEAMKFYISILSALLLVACASYSGRGLNAGESRLEDVLRIMGNPAMQWQDPDGARQLAYSSDRSFGSVE